jgi:hypothetical protein
VKRALELAKSRRVQLTESMVEDVRKIFIKNKCYQEWDRVQKDLHTWQSSAAATKKGTSPLLQGDDRARGEEGSAYDDDDNDGDDVADDVSREAVKSAARAKGRTYARSEAQPWLGRGRVGGSGGGGKARGGRSGGSRDIGAGSGGKGRGAGKRDGGYGGKGRDKGSRYGAAGSGGGRGRSSGREDDGGSGGEAGGSQRRAKRDQWRSKNRDSEARKPGTGTSRPKWSGGAKAQ